MPEVIIPLPDGTPIPPGPPPSGVLVTPQPAPLLPLDTFRSILGYNPYHFWGLEGAAVPIDSQCSTLIAEYTYQNSNIGGRDTIRQALINAQERLRGYLQYPIAPQYIEATVPYARYFNQQFQRFTPVDSTGRWVSAQMPDGYIEAIGIETLTLLGTIAVTYSDSYSSGVNDTFTVSVATTETDPANIAVYFAQGDRLNNESVGDRWRIQPVSVSIQSGIATIIGRSWLLVKPILYQGFTRFNALDPAVTANFVTSLEIYTRTTNPNGTTLATAQGNFLWETRPIINWWGFCCDTTSDPAAVGYSIARVGIRDERNGIVYPGEAIYNTTTQQWNMTIPPWYSVCRPPDNVLVRYKAGYPLDATGQMNDRFAKAVAYLAMAEMPERICACDEANRTLWYYQQELNRTGNIQQETFATTRQMLNNPLGNRRGHWYAWNEMNALKLTRGV